MAFDVEKNLERLGRLLGTDEGFYTLALHSFIESFLRYEKGYGEEMRFPDLTWAFREELIRDRDGGFVEGLNVLGRLGQQHVFTNKVRHAFEPLDAQEAAAATHLFLKFCLLAGIAGHPQAGTLESGLDLWKGRTSITEQNSIIRQMQRELENLRKEKESFAAEQDAYRKLKARIGELQHQAAGLSMEIEKRTDISKRKDEKIDTLRAERKRLLDERDDLLREAEKYGRFEKYLRYLGRLSLYTRTRMDYEQSIAELTPEQEAAVENIRLKKDYLIRGGAGTGKSLVLIESLRRAAMQDELDFGENEQVVLVTFTRTLAKYNRYISRLLGLDLPLDIISTADKLFYDKLLGIEPEAVYDFGLLDRYIGEISLPPFLTPAEMFSEIENFIFGYGISRKEYLDDMIPRKGMRKRISRAQRGGVWGIAEELIARMESTKVYTKNYGRLKLLFYLEEHPEDREIRNISYLFLDEVQDLTPVALKICRELTRRAVIMAGDTGQSLYNYQPPFERAGLDLRGNTKVLKTNFRNTRQIHEFAERFRSLAPAPETAGGTEPFAFREGPLPEVYMAPSAQGLQDYLVRCLSIYLEELCYDPENVVILVPRNRELSAVAERLAGAGYESEVITGEDFDFAASGKVRLSTLHSSKGLDFPVVFLYLPYLHRLNHFGEQEEEAMLRNLVYVGITRGMDNVLIFAGAPGGGEEPISEADPILADLAGMGE